jgi:hypothetical protein
MSSEAERIARREIAKVARAAVTGNLSPLEAVRKICALRFMLGDPNSEIFHVFMAIDSETDTLPLGDVRELWSPTALEKKDREMTAYFEWAKDDLAKGCQRLIDEFSKSCSTD